MVNIIVRDPLNLIVAEPALFRARTLRRPVVRVARGRRRRRRARARRLACARRLRLSFLRIGRTLATSSFERPRPGR